MKLKLTKLLLLTSFMAMSSATWADINITVAGGGSDAAPSSCSSGACPNLRSAIQYVNSMSPPPSQNVNIFLQGGATLSHSGVTSTPDQATSDRLRSEDNEARSANNHGDLAITINWGTSDTSPELRIIGGTPTDIQDGDRRNIQVSSSGDNRRIDPSHTYKDFRVMHIFSGKVKLMHLNISGGSITPPEVSCNALQPTGGGLKLESAAKVTMEDVRLYGNALNCGKGGGIFSEADLTLVNSIIEDNKTIASESSNVEVTAISDGRANPNNYSLVSQGGGIFNNGAKLKVIRG